MRRPTRSWRLVVAARRRRLRRRRRRRTPPARRAARRRVDPRTGRGDRRLGDLGHSLGAGCRQRRGRLRAHARSRVVPAALQPIVPRARRATPTDRVRGARRARAQVQDRRHRHWLQRGQLDDGDVVPAIVQRARKLGYQRIVWWTLRSDVDYVSPGSVGNHLTFAQSNQISATCWRRALSRRRARRLGRLHGATSTTGS